MNINALTAHTTAPTGAPTNNTSATQPAADAENTFLKLLVTQLKTQDPTSPMDPTQMVGQMLSMNQLDQLIQIHQLLQSSASATTPTTTIPPATTPTTGG